MPLRCGGARLIRNVRCQSVVTLLPVHTLNSVSAWLRIGGWRLGWSYLGCRRNLTWFAHPNAKRCGLTPNLFVFAQTIAV